MNNSTIVAISLLCLFSLLFSFPSSAGVRSITIEIDAKSNGVEIGKKVIVSCRFGHGKREILKKVNEREWCDTRFSDICSGKKNVAAKLVCTDDYHQKIASQKSIDIKEVAILKEELREIEFKRLDIADKALELKRRELKLRK